MMRSRTGDELDKEEDGIDRQEDAYPPWLKTVRSLIDCGLKVFLMACSSVLSVRNRIHTLTPEGPCLVFPTVPHNLVSMLGRVLGSALGA
ncbi:hypothetical protein KCU61_g258, partial [Aureobasidium melanogenum]